MKTMIHVFSVRIGVIFILVLAVAMLAAWANNGCK